MSAIKTLIGKHDQKLSIAIVGLGNSGKTSFVKRILQKDELIHATIGNTSNFELHLYGNLTLITWDLDDKIPENNTMWKRSILGADVLFYIVDSADNGNVLITYTAIDNVGNAATAVYTFYEDNNKPSITIDSFSDPGDFWYVS